LIRATKKDQSRRGRDYAWLRGHDDPGTTRSSCHS
jgi:hypothetical protein